jgi:hypothetical protein
LQFSLQAASPETSGCTLVPLYGKLQLRKRCIAEKQTKERRLEEGKKFQEEWTEKFRFVEDKVDT